MTKPAAIAAQLVDVRNVNTHKCVRLILDVPAEQAMLVMEAFGWPTQVNPVPVAIARLNPSKLGGEPACSLPPVEAAGPCGESPDRPHKPRKPLAADKRLAQQAGILCADPVFQQFLLEHRRVEKSEEAASAFVRLYCGVTTRSNIIPGAVAADCWNELHGQFIAWKIAA